MGCNMKDNYKYYSLKNILSKHAQYNMIIGERSNGKTYAVTKHIIEQYIKTGGEGAIIRRWGEDFKNKRGANMFTALVNDRTLEKLSKGKYNNIIYRGKMWYLVNTEDESICDCFCYAFALSEMEHDKSVSYPNVTTILFDEFLTRGYYLVDEFVTFINVLSTIIRDRDNVTIFMCGNTVNKWSPYFNEFGLTHIKNMKQGDIDVYTYGNSGLKVAVEYCSTSLRNRVKKASDVYFAFNNPKLEMVTKGTWLIDNYPHLPHKYKPNKIEYTFFVVFDGETLQCEVVSDNDLFVYIHRKTTELKYRPNDVVYDLGSHAEPNLRFSFIRPIDRIDEKIYSLYKAKRFFYQSNDIGEILNNFVKSSK